MPAESAADRASFVGTGDFGVAATYTLAGGGDTTVNGIFDDEFAAVDVDAGAPITATKPQFECVEADLPAGRAQRDTITISGTVYVVQEIMPDGTGMVVLMLDEQ